MNTPTLHEIAEAAGVLVDWIDAAERPQRVSDAALERVLSALGYSAATAAERRRAADRLVAEASEAQSFCTATIGERIPIPLTATDDARAALELDSGQRRDIRLLRDGALCIAPAIAEPGYHRLELGEQALTIAVAPRRAYGLDDIAPGARLWGAAAQIYALPGAHDYGDLGDAARAAVNLAHYGADALAISPCHALFTAAPERYGPYAPSTRLWLNPLCADPRAALEELAHDAPRQTPTELIDWPRAGAARLAWLRLLHGRFKAQASAEQRGSFARFVHEGGDALVSHARFEALHGHVLEQGGVFDWRAWPAQYRDAQAADVTRFARTHAGAVDFHLFLQWLAAESLAAAQQAARGAGMRIGLITDIAVGVDPCGSQAWSRPGEMLSGVSIGAPPDLLGPMGQDWGVTTFSPAGLRRAGFAGFIETLRANLRSAGGARIDHILGLRRLWLVPHGCASREGAYLRYPEQHLLRLLKLESHRARAIIIGEDLGTVPVGFSEMLKDTNLLGVRVLHFQRDKTAAFVAPSAWPRSVAAMTTTHDLPTVAGWWTERDIDWRMRLDHLPESEHSARARRGAERAQFSDAALRAGAAQRKIEDAADAVDAALNFVARTPSQLMLAPMEDLIGATEQPNFPGTIDEHPNWRRRLPPDALDQPNLKARAARLLAERGRS